MASRRRASKGGSEAEAEYTGASGIPRARSPAHIRIAVLTAMLMLGIMSVVSMRRLVRPAPVADKVSIELATDARVTAAQVDGRLSSVQAALAAARATSENGQANPIDATDLARKSASALAPGVAIVDQTVLAQSGSAKGADWLKAAASARRAGKAFWVGADSTWVYAAAPITGPQGPAEIVAAIDPAKLLPAGIAPVQALATPDGLLLSAHGTGGIDQASSLKEALAITPADVTDGQAQGKAPDGTPVRVVVGSAGDGGLIVLMGEGGMFSLAAPSQMAVELIIAFGPMAIGVLLTMLLMVQSRQARVAQRAFTDTEQRFRLAVEAARCGIWEWDLQTDRVFMSDVTGVILGWGGGGEVESEQVLSRIAPDHRQRVRQALESARSFGAFDVSFRVPDRNGRTAWIDARGQGLDAGESGYKRIIGVALDVTDERIAQARAQAAENRLRDAIDSVSEAFVLWDRLGRLLMCNSNFRAFFSLEPRLLKPGASRESVSRFVQLAIRREHPSRIGEKGLREVELNDGRWLQISERRTAEGGLVVTAVDITAIKKQEEARRKNEEELQAAVFDLQTSQEQLAELARKYEEEKIRAEGANRAKSEFLANMSHELRTPLNAINGFSEIMVSELFGPVGDKRYAGYCQDILNSGQHLLTLINDILDMAKIEAGKLNLKLEPMQLIEVVEDAVRLMRNRAESVGLELVMDFPTLPEVDGDYRALKQVLLNLLSNAIKFTPRGGRVTVNAALEMGPQGERVRVGVQDTGIGISEKDMQRLAQPFEQIESQLSKTTQGSGLGLALTKSLVEMHGGSLDMKSEPGKGTFVSFTLPVQQGIGVGPRSHAAA